MTKFIFLTLISLISCASYANFPEHEECAKGNARSCLRMAIKLKGRDSLKYTVKAGKLFDAEKTENNRDAFVVASSVYARDNKELQKKVSTLCQKKKFIEACFIDAVKTIAEGKDVSAKNKERYEALKASCAKNDSYGCHLYGMVQMMVGNQEEGKASLEKACDLKDWQSCVDQADDLRAKSKIDTALPLFQKACDANYPTACERIATIWRQNQKVNEASELLIKKCNAGNEGACGYIGDIKYEEKKFDEAEKYYQVGCGYDAPELCVSYASRSLVDKKSYGPAKLLLNRFCNEENPEACYEFATLSNKLGDEKGTKQGYTKACDHGFGKGCMGLIMVDARQKKPDMKSLVKHITQAKDYLSSECNDGQTESCKKLEELSQILQKIGL